jgi:agmatinase
MMAIERLPIPFAGCFTNSVQEHPPRQLVFAGLPDDAQSSFRRGSRHGPERIRQAYDGNCYNSTTELGVELANQILDYGDLPLLDLWEHTAQSYRQTAGSFFRAGKIPFFAGGDHAVTIPIGAALAELGEPVHIIQLDAHPDLYPEFEGNCFSHACTAARLLEMDHIASVTQIGVRTMNAVQADCAQRYSGKVHFFFAKDLGESLPAMSHIPKDARVYLTFDLDVFDPAFAPGVAHPVPGGLTPRQALNFIQNAAWIIE